VWVHPENRQAVSRWNHACCELCWIQREGEWAEIQPGVRALTSVRRPVRQIDAPIEECCFCGGPTISGIYVRTDPASLSCSHTET
jgi:hypothetical protein